MTAYTISAGQTSNGLTLNDGDRLTVLSGGAASATTTDLGGRETVFGADIAATVNTGGVETVSSGGTASGTMVNSGGVLNDHGTTTGATVGRGGREFVYAGGVASATTISGGLVEVTSGGAIGDAPIVSPAAARCGSTTRRISPGRSAALPCPTGST